ncbi:MAG TPA: methyltransferase domain-containing protein [Verrucomicrobiae bacterium]|nr:methyltransferase domain-containing protein [Verrucomicrobiae bacterium]
MKSLFYLPKTFPNFALATYAASLDSSLKNCTSILDIGCGSNSPLKFISKKQIRVGVDGYKPAIDISRKSNIHDEYEILDIRNLLKKFKKNQFDAVIALDVIEHLKKKEGEKLLKDMEEIAAKKVIILTPNGFVKQYDPINKLQEHLSGWTMNDFINRGYKVSGMYGWKPLRGAYANLKFKPKLISGAISEFTHYVYTSRNPVSSFSLFAVKTLQ